MLHSRIDTRTAELGWTVPLRVAVALVLSLQLVLIWRHVPWLDELQALQIVVQSPTLPYFLDLLRYEGHPPLWYALLYPLALVLPIDAVLPAAVTLTGAGTAALILTNRRIPPVLCLGILASYYLVFEFGVISRASSLGVMAMFACARFWHRRSVWVWLAVLPAIDFLFGLVSLVLLAVKWREGGLHPAMALWVASGLLSAWTVRPPDDVVAAMAPEDLGLDVVAYFSRLGMATLPVQRIWNVTYQFNIVTVLLLGLLAVRQLAHNRIALVAFAGLTGLTFVFSITVYPMLTRHLMLIPCLLIVLSIVLGSYTSLFRLWVGTVGVLGVAIGGYNLVVPFTGSDNVARYILAHELTNRPYVVWPQTDAQAVFARSGLQYQRVGQDCMSSLTKWNLADTADRDVDGFRAWLDKRQKQGAFYLVTTMPVRGINAFVRFPAGYDGRAYQIARMGDEARRYVPPPCLPDLKPMPAAISKP